jgi:hypothetical protein
MKNKRDPLFKLESVWVREEPVSLGISRTSTSYIYITYIFLKSYILPHTTMQPNP